MSRSTHHRVAAFTPDPRNAGGRKVLLDHLKYHTQTLRILKASTMTKNEHAPVKPTDADTHNNHSPLRSQRNQHASRPHSARRDLLEQARIARVDRISRLRMASYPTLSQQEKNAHDVQINPPRLFARTESQFKGSVHLAGAPIRKILVDAETAIKRRTRLQRTRDEVEEEAMHQDSNRQNSKQDRIYQHATDMEKRSDTSLPSTTRHNQSRCPPNRKPWNNSVVLSPS